MGAIWRVLRAHRDLRLTVVLAGKRHGRFRRREYGDSAGSDGSEALRLHLVVVRLRRDREFDYSCLLLEKQRNSAAEVCCLDTDAALF